MILSKLFSDPPISHQPVVMPLLKTVSTANMQSHLEVLTAFHNRYYKASTGADASVWIRDVVAKVCISSILSSFIFDSFLHVVHKGIRSK